MKLLELAGIDIIIVELPQHVGWNSDLCEHHVGTVAVVAAVIVAVAAGICMSITTSPAPGTRLLPTGTPRSGRRRSLPLQGFKLFLHIHGVATSVATKVGLDLHLVLLLLFVHTILCYAA